jgi:DegV family protein with EDD domain
LIKLVTDSSSQITRLIQQRHDVRVVPLTIIVDGQPFLEGVDLDCETFYKRLAAGAQVSTSAPSPGDFLKVYEEAKAAGADGILSVHIGSGFSGTLNSAKVAADQSPLEVRLVDTQTTMFGISCCVAAAGRTLDTGGDLAEAEEAAQLAANLTTNIFVVGSPHLLRSGGRGMVYAQETAGDEVTVWMSGPRGREVIGRVSNATDILDLIVEQATLVADLRPVLCGIGDVALRDMGDRLEQALRQVLADSEIERHTLSPSIGAYSGPGSLAVTLAPISL